MKQIGTSSLYLFLVLGAFSCKQEEDPMLRLIHGRWEIREAYRNQQRTESLDGLFFNFGENGHLETNLPLSDTPSGSTYQLKKGVVYQAQGTLEVEYQIEAISDTLLVLTTTLQEFPFRFVLEKAATDSSGAVGH